MDSTRRVRDNSAKGDAKVPDETPVDDEESRREAELQAATIGEVTRVNGQVQLVDYDPAWPRVFERERRRIRSALGDRALLIEHVGSTSVPGLAAKPRIDILLVVADSSSETAYVPELEAAGYILRIREPEWYEHRMFNAPDTALNLHVLSAGCAEIDRMLGFRDHLRQDDADRELYERTKRELAQREWRFLQDYADAKSQVVEEIIARVNAKTDRISRGTGA